jgi:outer membrane lipoprotein-sorting protein
MNRLLSALALVAGLCVAPAARAATVSADSTDARAIMEAVESRETGDKTTLTLTITITDKAGRSRTRVLKVRSMEFDDGIKQLLLFEKPADLFNAGLLSVDYSDGNATDDQWLYLPSLGKTTRIASADKSGSFMGTDLTYADMTKKDPSAYDYNLVEQSVSVDGEDCWLIEATPKTEKEQKETGYTKTQVWVSKDKLVPLQIKAALADGSRIKYTKMSDVRLVDDVWMAHQVVVRTVQGGEVESTSTLLTSGVTINDASVTDADFTEQRLEQGL